MDQGLLRASAEILRNKGWDIQHPELAELVEKIWSRIGQQLENGAMTTITEKAMRIRKTSR